MFPADREVRLLETLAFDPVQITDYWTAYYREQYDNRLFMRNLALSYSE
jgi:hypothetical protein